MPREIKTTLAVDGEAAFKRAINDANTSMKNLGTQLTLAAANFKKDGDAMKLMETRSKALNAEITQQNEIVKSLQKAVEDSTKAYGENSAKTEKWQAELNRAQAKLVSLQNELTLNEAGLDRNGKAFDESSQKAADYQATLEGIGKNVSFESISSGVGKITGAMEAAFRKAVSLGNQIREWMVNAGEWADQLKTDATTSRLTVEEMQRWRYASQFVDTDVNNIIAARDRLEKKMAGEWKDNGLDMWEISGLNRFDENGNFRNSMDMLFDVGEFLRNVAWDDKNEIRADVYAMELFGKSYRELLPLFEAGREGWEKYKSEAVIVSDDYVNSASAMADSNDRVKSSWEALQMTAAAALAPTFVTINSSLADLLGEINEWLQTDDGKEAMQGLAEAIESLFKGITDIEFADAVNVAKDAIHALTDGLNWLSDNKGSVFEALKVIAGGFALLKVSEGVLAFLKLKAGWDLWRGKNIFGNKSGGAPAEGAEGAGEAAASGGGWLSWLSNTANKVGTTANNAVASGAVWNGAFLLDAFMHNTNAGRAINSEYGGSFSLENLLSGFYQDVNEAIGDSLKRAEEYESGEIWSVLDPESKKRHDELEQEKLETEYWREKHAEETAAAIEAEKQRQEEPGIWNPDPLKRALLPTPEEIRKMQHEEWLGDTTVITSASGAAQAETEPKIVTPMKSMEDFASEMTDAQVSALEQWWDAVRSGDDDTEDAKDKINEAFAENEALLDEFFDAFERWKDDYEGDDYHDVENLLTSDADKAHELEHLSESSSLLDDAAASLRVNTEAARTIADRMAGVDLKSFNSVPAQMVTAVANGAASGVSGIRVYMDGYAVGSLIAPYVSQLIGAAAM